METILAIQSAWPNYSALNALVPQNQVWLNIAGDTAAMPYVVLEQESVSFTYTFHTNYLSYTHFNVIVYAPTLAAVDAFQQEIISSFQCSQITSKSFGNYLMDIIPSAEQGSAYKGTTKWKLFEAN